MDFKKAKKISELVKQKEEHDEFFKRLGNQEFHETTLVEVYLKDGFLNRVMVNVDTKNLIGLIAEEQRAINYALEQSMESR